MQRIVLAIEYDGHDFCGWQWQPGKRSVQQALEHALSHVANQPITVLCAGRTDAGVHALEQIVHFDTVVQRDLHAWLLGGNSHLPPDVRILRAHYGVSDFHARYSAIARFYRYRIINRAAKPALMRGRATWCYAHLHEDVMHKAAQMLIGEHDFSSFRAQGCQSKSPVRVLHFIDVYRIEEEVVIDVAANAFVHHMVRNIAGALIEIGIGKRAGDWVAHLLMVKNRSCAGITAAPDGLYLAGVYYPKRYGLPAHPVFNKLPAGAKRHH
jgi:tRNA pseudouridine38-40 synthase